MNEDDYLQEIFRAKVAGDESRVQRLIADLMAHRRGEDVKWRRQSNPRNNTRGQQEAKPEMRNMGDLILHADGVYRVVQ